jgi:ubiquinone biosynthesis protein
MLPKPYRTLAQLFDGAEPIPYQAVRNVVHEELGMWPEEIFAEFDPDPIGSAVSNTELHCIREANQILGRVSRKSTEPSSIRES